jgi:hypothetical protein
MQRTWPDKDIAEKVSSLPSGIAGEEILYKEKNEGVDVIDATVPAHIRIAPAGSPSPLASGTAPYGSLFPFAYCPFAIVTALTKLSSQTPSGMRDLFLKPAKSGFTFLYS